MLEKIMQKLTEGAQWLFEDPSDAFRLARIMAIALPIGIIGFVTSVLMGLWGYALGWVLGVPALALAGFTFVQGVSGAAGGMYHSGSRKMNHAAVMKSMYNLAAGQTRTGQFSQARDKYMEILETYPEELDARYLLANLTDQHFGLPEEALRIFLDLRALIREKGIDYKYKVALGKRIAELEGYLAEEEASRKNKGR
ncbi:MAG: hypothetical protein OEZ55_10565 [Nitrospinota bacterium]|nr:hypothetical protein [Nitrospinota bacterium]